MATKAESKLVDRVRRMCTDLPEVSERLSHGEVTWFIRDKRVLAMMDDHHHGEDTFAVWVPAGPGVQDELMTADPNRYYRPPYVGPSGWVGVRLGKQTDWPHLELLVEDAYRLKAPKSLSKLLDAP